MYATPGTAQYVVLANNDLYYIFINICCIHPTRINVKPCINNTLTHIYKVYGKYAINLTELCLWISYPSGGITCFRGVYNSLKLTLLDIFFTSYNTKHVSVAPSCLIKQSKVRFFWPWCYYSSNDLSHMLPRCSHKLCCPCGLTTQTVSFGVMVT